ncbi:hypothetical protein [Janthinobacterium sp. J1-1]|uniref:hypothetical protein n=1 Tax=Janthinobacterium sp. J1-1 TaxID=3065910 RepID=UPI002811996D|nr:hypothetical protein [Janthinobacterium sp. J1-1]
MNLRLLILATLLLHITSVMAADTSPPSTPKPLRGDYQLYGGTLSEMLPPTPSDKKVAFMVTGAAAKDLFLQIGPDVAKENACSEAKDYRERRRGDLSCVHMKGAEYSCYFGLDLKTGKGIHGAIC